MTPRTGLLLATLSLFGCSQGGGLGSILSPAPSPPYALDDLTRDASPGDPCPEVPITSYRGGQLPYQPGLKVAEPFVSRLAQFESVVSRVSLATYGRVPSAVRHAGAYLCRPIRARAERWSEHAFWQRHRRGGLRLRAGRQVWERCRRAGACRVAHGALACVQVRVTKHWDASEGEAELLHRSFLRNLVVALREDDIFRAMIGPADPDHRTHLHLDMGPWHYERI